MAEVLSSGGIDALLDTLDGGGAASSSSSSAAVAPTAADPPAAAASTAATRPLAPLISVDLIEAVYVLVLELAASATEAKATERIMPSLSATIRSMPISSVTQAEAIRLVTVAQRLQLLVPESAAASAAISGFANIVPPRCAIGAKALSSPVLTLRLWAVKDLASLITQAVALAADVDAKDKSLIAPPRAVADALCDAGVPRLLLGDLAHEEVLRRATPIFTLLLQHDKMDDTTLRGLWAAPATKSAAVASAATKLLCDVLQSKHCPTRLPTALLDAIWDECSTNLSPELASSLATLGPIYAQLPHGLSNRLPLLLWHLLRCRRNASARRRPPRSRLRLWRRCEPARSSSVSRRLPLQCGLFRGSVASLSPRHGRHTGAARRHPPARVEALYLARTLGGASAAVRAAHWFAAAQRLPPLATLRIVLDRARKGNGASSTLSGQQASIAAAASSSALENTPAVIRGKPTDLPPALAAAGDRLPQTLALEMITSIAEADKKTETASSHISLLGQLESRLGLYSLATQLAARPTRDEGRSGGGMSRETPDENEQMAAAISASIEQISCALEGEENGGGGGSFASSSSAAVEQPPSGSISPQRGPPSPPLGGAESPSRRPSREMAIAAERSTVQARLEFLTFVASELDKQISQKTLEAIWAAMRSSEAREVLLLWLPTARQSLSPEALAHGYLELLLNELRWDTLTPQQYNSFEALYRHYHVSKGHLKYSSPTGEATSSTGGFLSRLFTTSRTRRAAADETQHELSELVIEAVPSSLQGTQQLWLTVACAPEETSRMALPLLVQLHLRPASHIDATIVRQELLQGCFHAMHRLTAQNAPADMVSTSWRPEPTAGDRLGALPASQQAQHAIRAPTAGTQGQVLLLLELLSGFLRACGEARKLIPHHASWRGQSCALTVNVEGAPPPLIQADESKKEGKDGGKEKSGSSSHRRSHSSTSIPSMAAAALVPFGGGGGSKESKENVENDTITDESGGGANGSLSSSAGGDAGSGNSPTAENNPSSPTLKATDGNKGMRLEFLVHDNLTLGLLRQRIKRELVAASLPKISYSSILLMKDDANMIEAQQRAAQQQQPANAIERMGTTAPSSTQPAASATSGGKTAGRGGCQWNGE